MVAQSVILRRGLRRQGTPPSEDDAARARFRSRIRAVTTPRRPCRLFMYGTLMAGERDHALLAGAELLGLAVTEPLFQLIDLGVYAALIPDGKVAVHGELYAASLETRRQIDVQRQVPILFQRSTVRLADGTAAEAYVMAPDPVRGKR